MTRLTLGLVGPVHLLGPRSENLTPRGMRARGALAIMGTAANMQISRSRLQDLLFSDREPEHGSASLRQLLREIRIALNGFREVLISGPGWVGFDTRMVQLDLTARRGADGRQLELAADLDIPDPEFEDWLRDARSHFEDQADEQLAQGIIDDGTPALILQAPMAADPAAAVTAAMILQEAAERASDLLPIQVIHGDPGLARISTGIELGAMANRIDGEIVMLFSARLRHDGRLLWSRRFSIPVGNTMPHLKQVSGGVTIAILHGVETLHHTLADPGLRRMPLQDVFSFSSIRLKRADDLLTEISAEGDNPVILALRSYIRHTMLVERLTTSPAEDEERATSLAARAREIAPGNSTALAVNALVAIWRRQFEMAFDMARHATSIDSENPIARLAYSSALTSLGRHREAEIEASGAQLSALSELGPAAWILRRAIAATRIGDLRAAEHYFSTAHGYAPDNRPALRFLGAIRFELGDEAGALAALQKLKKIEPDFSLDLMASDTYPVSSLRSAGLLKVTRSGLI